MAIERSQIREGMTVRAADGEKLGKVLTCDEQTFIVEKGFFFPKDYVARYEDVAAASGHDIRLRAGREALRNLDELQGALDVRVQGDEGDREGHGARAGREGVPSASDLAARSPTAAGPAVGASTAGPIFGAEAAARAAGEVRTRLHEEEDVEVRRRPVVMDEVRARKDRLVEQRAADAERREGWSDEEGDEGSRLRRDEETKREDPGRD